MTQNEVLKHRNILLLTQFDAESGLYCDHCMKYIVCDEFLDYA